MQPGVVPGAVYEFHAARAALGLTPGVNDPLTTQAFDTSGSGNHGTLTNFAGTPASGYAGAGTIADPYRLTFDPATTADYVTLPDLGVAEAAGWCHEAWFKDDGAKVAAMRWATCESGAGSIRSGIHIWDGSPYFQTRDATTYANMIYPVGTFSSDGLWHHVLAGVAGGFMKLFVDGVDRSGTPVAARPPAALTTSRIGGYPGGLSWNGGIAAARMYPFAPTLAMARQNYNAGPLWAPAMNLPVIGSPIVKGIGGTP